MTEGQSVQSANLCFLYNLLHVHSSAAHCSIPAESFLVPSDLDLHEGLPTASSTASQNQELLNPLTAGSDSSSIVQRGTPKGMLILIFQGALHSPAMQESKPEFVTKTISCRERHNKPDQQNAANPALAN